MTSATDRKPALEAAIEGLIREKGPLHRTDIEFYIFEACAHEQPGYEAFAREALRGGIRTNVSTALADLLHSGQVTGPTAEGFNVPAFTVCGVCAAPLDPDSEGIDVCEPCWREAHRG